MIKNGDAMPKEMADRLSKELVEFLPNCPCFRNEEMIPYLIDHCNQLAVALYTIMYNGMAEINACPTAVPGIMGRTLFIMLRHFEKIQCDEDPFGEDKIFQYDKNVAESFRDKVLTEIAVQYEQWDKLYNELSPELKEALGVKPYIGDAQGSA